MISNSWFQTGFNVPLITAVLAVLSFLPFKPNLRYRSDPSMNDSRTFLASNALIRIQHPSVSLLSDEESFSGEKMMDELQFPVCKWPIGGPLDLKELDL